MLCVFCEIVAGRAAAHIVAVWPDCIAFRPLNPVCSGHVLVIPRAHVESAAEEPAVTGLVMTRAAQLVQDMECPANILTSIGRAATQSVMHLHLHVVPRWLGDGLMLPWGTTGDPHEPHRCPGMDRLAAELAAFTNQGLIG